MRKLIPLFIALAFAVPAAASDNSKNEPVQHLKIADVVSMEEAKHVFLDSTSEIRKKKALDEAELQQIHIITYSLEKSVAYFAENLSQNNQDIAKEIAIIVEEIHLNSENNRKEETKTLLSKYFPLAEILISNF